VRVFRPLLVLLLCAVASLSQAARLSERSPVRMGLWWDPQHSGSGFELFRGSEEVAAIWYTYGEDGAPLWYSAIARFDKFGLWRAPLMQHRWANGAHAGATQVGELVFERRNFEAIGLRWKIGAREGTQALVPFPVSGIVPEVDHSGAWYDPARSGFGLSLTEQGEWLGGALYFYDGSGKPTWAVGNNAGAGTDLDLQMLSGRCPGCASGGSRVLGTATLSLRFAGDARLDADYRGSGPAAWPLDGELVQVSLPASRRPADRQLAAFEHASQLQAFLAEALVAELDRPPMPVVDFSPAPQGSNFSSTNLVETGADEADRLKTDGRWIYSVRPTRTPGEPATVRIAEVGDAGAQLAVRNTFNLPADANGLGYGGLYLTDHTLIALSSSEAYGYPGGIWSSIWAWAEGRTHAALYDRTLPGQPQLRKRVEFDAHLIASRRIGDRMVLVLRSTSEYPELDANLADAQVREAIRATPLEQLLPRMRIDGGEWRTFLDPSDVHLPIYGQRVVTPELVTVVTIDLAAPDRIDAIAVAGRVDAVYATPDTLYLANSRHALAGDSVLGTTGHFQVTDVHRVGLGAAGPVLQGTGSVEGYLDRDLDRAPFRFSEHRGKLRVVTVSDGMWGAQGANRLTVLEPSTVAPGLLRTVSYLPNRARPAPLGKPGEHLYATRFVGDTLYAVTFLKVDPLYVVDLSDPAAPAIAGEVDLPGFSEYLHPVGDKLLLGIGYDAVQPAGQGFAWFQGLQFTLFDVSVPTRPRVIQQSLLGKRPSSSAAIRDHHAISALRFGETTRFTLPVRVHESDGSEGPSPPLNYYYPWSWSGLQSVEVTSLDPATARLQSSTALITHRRTAPENLGYSDDALYYARSIQFTRGTVYVEQGRFWLSGNEGSFISGPQ
jgi:hypothetical protein